MLGPLVVLVIGEEDDVFGRTQRMIQQRLSLPKRSQVRTSLKGRLKLSELVARASWVIKTGRANNVSRVECALGMFIIIDWVVYFVCELIESCPVAVVNGGTVTKR